MLTNKELIPIYTDWVNRYLSKASITQNYKPIGDITNELRDYRVVARLIQVIVPENANSQQFYGHLSRVSTNIDGLDACLQYLSVTGIDCVKVTSKDIDAGQLSAVLKLLYSLSTYKQQQKQKKKEEKKQTDSMPPSVNSKLPSPLRPATTTSESHLTPSSNTKLIAPTRIALPKAREKSSVSPGRSTPSALLPPAPSKLQPPSKNNGNNNGSALSSRSTSTSSSITYTSIPGAAGNVHQTPARLKPPSSQKPRQLQPPTKANQLVLPKTSFGKTSTFKPAPTQAVQNSEPSLNQTRMLKLKLFGGKDKEKKTPQSSPSLTKKLTTSSSNVSTTKTGSSVSHSKMTEPRTAKITIRKSGLSQPVQFRIKPPTIAAPTINTELCSQKRTSKSSEEDSAYAGFGSASPASSTQSSMSLQSNSSKGSHDVMCDTLSTTERHTRMNSSANRKESDSQDKPTMAVKGIAAPTSRMTKAREQKVNQTDNAEVTQESSESNKTVNSPTVGVVSPMLNQNRTLDAEASSPNGSPNAVDCQPSSSKTEEKKKPPVPSRACSRLETTFDREVSTTHVPAMAPIRQPPAYHQLIQEGKINGDLLGQFVDSSTSEDSLDSVSTTIRLKPSGYTSEGNTLDRPGRHINETSGYTSEGGIAIYAKMQAKLREYRDSMRRGQVDINDSFEDSSSISSGISENFDDVSTDDLSGTDHPMAVAAYGKLGDYQHFSRSNGRGPRSSSSSIDTRAKRIAEQENIHQLLQQCRTSQRGVGCQISNLRSPGYSTISSSFNPQIALSADGDILSVHSRNSLRISPKRQDQTVPSLAGYHSLDRKYHMADFYREDSSAHRLALFDQRSAMALVSPRRVPQISDSMQRHSVTGSLSARGPEGIYANCGGRDSIHLHRLTDEVQSSPSHGKISSGDVIGSQLSLVSGPAYNSLSDKYESDIRKMSRELEGYKHTINRLTRKQEDYSNVMDVFENKLSQLSKQVDKAQLKPDELSKLRHEIEHLRMMSGRLAQGAENKKSIEGAGELLRQPSLESVASMASHRSSMSSSSKSSKTDKSSLNSFGKTKRSWIRSSFTKAFSKKKNKNGALSDNEGSPMHHTLNPISGSTNRLDEVEVVELKKKLEDREVALTDIRLDALDKAREVDILRETVNRLKNENKQLKSDMSRLIAGRASRASSQASIPMLGDEDPVYEVPPSSSSVSYSSKRSSSCNSVKVTVNVDLRGEISAAICPDNEIIIGFLSLSVKDSTWEELDQQIFALFDAYISRIDPEHHLGLHYTESVIGYQMGDVVREKGKNGPEGSPGDVITATTTIRMFLRGAAQHAVDSLILECLFPRTMLEQLLKFLFSHKRLVLSGATGIGKSNLARQLASYLSVRIGLEQDGVVDIKIPDDTNDKGIVKVENQLATLLRSSDKAVVLIDNIPRHRIAFVSSVFSSVELNYDDGPFVICTVNRACQLPEMQVHHNFKMFLLTNRMDGVKGFMGRFLRRRMIESEFRLSQQTPPELVRVMQFLPVVLQAVNSFIEKANSLDVTVGPRIFLQCPLGVDESRAWFVRLWNQNILPYMVKVAREGVKVLGRCGSFEDPTDVVCEHWPWLEGPSGEELLHRLSIKETVGQTIPKQAFNPLDTLIRLQASRNATVENL